MNIAIFTNNYLPNPYGVTVSVETFREELEKRGHTVYIFAPKWKGYADNNLRACPPKCFSEKNSGRVFRYPSIDIEFKFRFPLPIPYSWKMLRILKNLKIDIIHSQHPNLLGTTAMRWAKKKKIPLVFTWHTLYDRYTNFIPLVSKKWAAEYIIKKATAYANRADAVIAPTASIIPILKKWGVKKEIIPIATGIKAEEFFGANQEVVRKKHGIASDELVLLLVSRLTEEKNIEFIFRAVKDILKNNKKQNQLGYSQNLSLRHSRAGGNPVHKPVDTRLDSRLRGNDNKRACSNIKFLVAGDGYLVPKLKKYCEEEKISQSVIFVGLVPHAELKNYYATADIFVYGSKSETQGIIPLEAMYMGLPIVAVDSTGISSLALNKANGFLVREDEKEFSDAVLKLINDTELRKRFGEASGKIARENFTSEVCADKLLKVYEKCLNHDLSD